MALVEDEQRDVVVALARARGVEDGGRARAGGLALVDGRPREDVDLVDGRVGAEVRRRWWCCRSGRRRGSS